MKTLDPSEKIHIISSDGPGTPDPRVCRLIIDAWDGKVGEIILLEPELINADIPKHSDVAFDRILLNGRHPEWKLLRLVTTRDISALLVL